MSYVKYLEDILGLNDDTGNQPFCRKKLFSFLKSLHADAQGIAVLKKGDAACTGNVDQVNLLYSQFQSVFAIRLPLSLAKLCHSKLFNGTASLLNLLTESVNCKVPLYAGHCYLYFRYSLTSFKSECVQGSWSRFSQTYSLERALPSYCICDFHNIPNFIG